MRTVETVVLLVALATVVAAFARRLRVRAPFLLVVAGLAVGLLPRAPAIDVPPGVVSLVVQRVRMDLLEAYPWVPVPDRAWETVRSVQARLAAKSQHNGLSVADHLVVATALHHKLTILHEDADFAAAAAVVSDIQEQRILTDETGTQSGAPA
jgi:predicted nucleic acid-binding protein